jgi:hypothetical protein
MPEAEADSLRAKLVADANTLLRPNRNRGGAGGRAKVGCGSSAPATGDGDTGLVAQQQQLLMKHGLVQVRAFICVACVFFCVV